MNRTRTLLMLSVHLVSGEVWPHTWHGTALGDARN